MVIMSKNDNIIRLILSNKYLCNKCLSNKIKVLFVVNQMIPMCEKVEVSEGMRESQHMRVRGRR